MFPFLYKKSDDANRSSTLIIFVDGTAHTFLSTAPQFESILQALKDNDDEKVRSLVNLKKSIADYSNGLIEIHKDELYFDGSPLRNSIVTRILQMFKEGWDVTPMALFLNNLMQNPSKDSINELYNFLEACDLPITEDGHFLAYKIVNSEYRDCYTNTFDNSVGAVVKMDRDSVNPNRNETCSSGLHFCSKEYISAFNHYGAHLMVVKINPKDVVSIPIDYNNSKGRCCEYTVIREIEAPPEIGRYFSHDGNDNDDNDDGDDEFETIRYDDNQDFPLSSQELLSDSEILEIRRMIDEGFTLKAIGEMFNRSPRTIARVRDGEGAYKHAPAVKEQSETPSDRLSDATVRKIRKMLDNNESLVNIGKSVNRSPRTIARIRDGESYQDVN